MKIKHEVTNGILNIAFEGDLLGESNGLEVINIVNNEINNGISKCAFDLSNVRYMNSSGIGVLITTLTKFRNKGGDVILVKPNDQIKKLLTITKLNVIFQLVDDLGEAYNILNKK